MSKASPLKSFSAAFVGMASLAAIIQDVLMPLIKIGFLAGVFCICLSILFSFGPDKSAWGTKIREHYPYWKWGVVIATLLLGLIVLGASEYSKTNGKKMVVAAKSEDIAEEIEKGKDVDDFEHRSGGILAKYISDLTSLQKAIASVNDKQLKTLAEIKEIKASIVAMHEDVRHIKQTTEDTNRVVKDTNLVVKDTNTVVKDTNAVIKDTNIVAKDTHVIVKDTNMVTRATKADTEKLLLRTEKTPHETLSSRGFQNDSTSFLRALKVLRGDNLKEILSLFHAVGYDPLEKHTNWQTVASIGFIQGLTDTLGTELMYAPSTLTTFSLLSASDIEINNIILVSEIFGIPINTATDSTETTYAKNLNPSGIQMGVQGHPNPEAASGWPYNSLISYYQGYTNNVSNQIGNWTLLHTAAYFGKYNNIAPLIEAGLDPNQQTSAGHTALSLPFEYFYKKDREHIARTVDALINKGADVDAHNQVALITAAMSGLNSLKYTEAKFERGIGIKPISPNTKYEISKLGVYEAMIRIKRSSSGISRKVRNYVVNTTERVVEGGHYEQPQKKMALSFVKTASR
ncbi:hypothetical protein GTQ48_13575 [Alteromonas genovensis]|uniref:Uncharacterized protein n=1 Tax=Alteromonas genovensis TaxID=471225 RepID=A0A6N9TGV8_9ALTE|nr:ankyrin repeat domain-containing protein [Alteromonas genovensis]NDW16543.1 hypothetical protein [Alteromonas genovensis]